MLHLVVAAEVWILVFQRVEAVGAGRHDGLHLIAVEELHVPLGHDFEEILVADAPGRVAVARLLWAQDGVRHAGAVKDAGHGSRGALAARLQGRRATHPEQDLDGFVVFGGLGQQADRQALGPVGAGRLAPAPGVAPGLQAAQCLLGARGHPGLGHDQVATQVDDAIDVLHQHRALLLTGAAGDAVPDPLLGKLLVEERLLVGDALLLLPVV